MSNKEHLMSEKKRKKLLKHSLLLDTIKHLPVNIKTHLLPYAQWYNK